MKRKFKCRDCKRPCITDGGRCAKYFRIYLKVKRAQIAARTPEEIRAKRHAANNKGTCLDCKSQCGTFAKRCKKCSVAHSKGISRPHTAKVSVDLTEVKLNTPKPTFMEWLKKRDEFLFGMLGRLKRENENFYKRALKGILDNIAAQKLNARKSGVSLRIDTDPIREILTDAKSGKFYCEDNEGFCPPMSLYRFEVYYTV